jgi:hypothetical protein
MFWVLVDDSVQAANMLAVISNKKTIFLMLFN